jgi:2-oxoglutarate dehydrogenase E2 component (dihydrolipoamide succinyltransferase)
MGESIFEGTITKWLKKPGDKVQRDEPLFEISTDKVDAEIPAPASGILQDIKVVEGNTVQVNTVVGTIAGDGEAASSRPAAQATAPEPAPSSPQKKEAAPTVAPPAEAKAETVTREEADDHARSSPLVRKIAREHDINLSQVTGTGLGGRITKQDIMAFLEKPQTAAAPASASSSTPAPAPLPRPTAPPVTIPGDLVPLTQMRKIIAQRMFEVDITRIVQLRNKTKSAFEQRHGARLTFMPFFVRAVIIALQQFPIVNASLEGENIRYHRHVNVGIAVALDWGLIVPVLKNADELNFLGLQRGISDLGERSRTKKLKPEEVEGSTFTVTNPGQFGAVFGLPIINQPNSAILGVGGITKAPLVVTDDDGNDSIAIRSVVHLTLGYDHRLIDGAVADQFMALVKKTLENWSEEVG